LNILNSWTGLWLAAAAGCVLELGKDAVGQFMISRPIVFSPVAGYLFGSPGLGLELGVLYELFGLAELPVGGRLPLNVAVAGISGLLWTMGPRPLPVEIAFPAGLLCGWLHARAEAVLRGRFAEQSWPQGGKTFFSFFIERTATVLARQAGLTACFLGALLALRLGIESLGGFHLGVFQGGLRFAFILCPWLALANLVRSMRLVV